MKSFRNIGKSGLETSFVLRKSLLKKIQRGGGATCQESIENNVQWLQLTQTLQNIPGKGIATMVGNIDSLEVIVKVQMHDRAKSEYGVQQRLKDLSGFVEYTCFFTCEGDKRYIESFSLAKDARRLCKEKGVSMGVIVMPYHKNGSFEEYLMTNPDKDAIKKIICVVVSHVFEAYTVEGFTHGDLFAKNIVLDKDYGPVILDFEKSKFSTDVSRFWLDLDDFLNDVARFSFAQELEGISRMHVVMNRAYRKRPTDDILDSLLSAIKDM